MTLLEWSSRAVESYQCVEPGCHADWLELMFRHHAVRLPGEADDIRRGEFHVRRDLEGREEYAHAPVRTREDGSTWVYLPHYDNFDPEPFEVTVDNDQASIAMAITVGWTVWSMPYSPGYRDIAAGLDRLVALGWTIAEDGVLTDA